MVNFNYTKLVILQVNSRAFILETKKKYSNYRGDLISGVGVLFIIIIGFEKYYSCAQIAWT